MTLVRRGGGLILFSKSNLLNFYYSSFFSIDILSVNVQQQTARKHTYIQTELVDNEFKK